MIVTKEQAELGPLYREKWIKKALSTEPVARELAEKRFAALYGSVGLTPPIVQWYPSPIKGAAAALQTALYSRRPTITEHVFINVLNMISIDVRSRIPYGFGNPSGGYNNSLERQMDNSIADKNNYSKVYSTLHELLFKPVTERSTAISKIIAEELYIRADVISNDGEHDIRDVEKTIDDALERRKIGRLLDYLTDRTVYGSLDSQCFVVYDYATRVLGEERLASVDALMDATSEVGCYWPFEHTVITCDRPRVMLFDGDGLPHSSRSFALAWPDAFGICCHHGVRIPTEALSNGGVSWKDLAATADKSVQKAIVEIKADEWSASKKKFNKKDVDEQREAALAVQCLGGVAALKDLIEGDE